MIVLEQIKTEGNEVRLVEYEGVEVVGEKRYGVEFLRNGVWHWIEESKGRGDSKFYSEEGARLYMDSCVELELGGNKESWTELLEGK